MKAEGLLTMSTREADRLKVIHEVLAGKLKQRQAGQQLRRSRRQIIRLCKRVRREGHRGIIHGLRGRPSNHQLKPDLLDKALALVKAKYWDFGPTFANEKLSKLHGIKVSTSALRSGMIQDGIWRAKEPKAKHRAWRERRACLGMLVQLDGSDHDWFEGRGPRCVLLVYIDDATSRILYAEFVHVEDTLTLMRATKTYLLRYGRPIAFYVDKDSIYKVNRQATIEEELREVDPITQFTRAMEELNIEVIPANSPQAKGRVERGFGTHQDRLVKEFRLAGISTMEAANKFLWEVYIPDHNARCAVDPANRTDAHRPLLKSHLLEEILSLRTERTVFNDFTVRFQNKFFQVLPDQPVRVRPKNKVLVEIRLDGSTHLRFKDQYLSFKPTAKRPYRPFYAARRERRAPATPPKSSTPGKHHPWRRFTLRKSPPLPPPASAIADLGTFAQHFRAIQRQDPGSFSLLLQHSLSLLPNSTTTARK